MKSASNLSRVLSAAMAALCSLGLLAAVGQQLTPQVVQLERVVVTAPAHAAVAAVAARTATN